LIAPIVLHGIEELRGQVAAARAGGRVGYVPTMGALHVGHACLIDEARHACSTVVVSIFVNPLQFDREEDLKAYPRTLEADLAVCRAHGVDLVFIPDAAEVYRRPQICTIDVGRLADHLCGRFRPGHFRGVATVVMKLLQMVQPDAAYFGEKDAQQLAIVRRLVSDFNLPVSIVGVPTVRDADGLALSSRNVHLSSSERALAPALYEALSEARRRIEAGVNDPGVVKRAALSRIPPATKLEYLEVVDLEELQPVTAIDGPVLVAAALWIGKTRLIDNVVCRPSGGKV
jgi:pantoate--beta-alanine ligase